MPKKKVSEEEKTNVPEAADLKEAISPEATEPESVADGESADAEKQRLAKAGKRSAKAVKAAEEQSAKEARKATSAQDGEPAPKPTVKPTRSRLERRGKRFRKAAELLEKDASYDLKQAVELVKQTAYTKFDATIELHVNLKVDPRQADQNIRDSLILPSGSGKQVRVAVFTDDATAAQKAGADIAGSDQILSLLEKGNLDFDVLIATPALMQRLGKYARLLGPRGLMPNPKSGTVTNDVTRALGEAKAGKVEYRVDSSGIVHLGVGKASFTTDQLLANVQAILTSIRSNKPSSLKGTYLKSMHLTATMGPSIAVDLSRLT